MYLLQYNIISEEMQEENKNGVPQRVPQCLLAAGVAAIATAIVVCCYKAAVVAAAAVATATEQK